MLVGVPADVVGRLVALLAEGVDRNDVVHVPVLCSDVALLAEGVDRNVPCDKIGRVKEGSPSSRRAWIEIIDLVHDLQKKFCRPPRGGRG